MEAEEITYAGNVTDSAEELIHVLVPQIIKVACRRAIAVYIILLVGALFSVLHLIVFVDRCLQDYSLYS